MNIFNLNQAIDLYKIASSVLDSLPPIIYNNASNERIRRMSQFRKIAVEAEISLSPKEKEIFGLLLRVVKDKAPNTVLRVAGGWVRDHALGKPSHDIDIAIDNMSGSAFGQLVLDWMREHNIDTKGMSVVKANPDQSKHLETAMINILGMPIDFVNLRKETYSDTRIPTIEPGSPEEDASRRDLTINALFYNLNTSEVEDFTGKGLEDLKNGVIRTPIDSVQTFLDDPLRILRSIRMATKFNFELSPELIEAAKNPAVQEAFRNKISPERIWKELAGGEEPEGWKPGFLSGANPSKAARMLGLLGLRDILFQPSPEDAKEIGVEFNHWDADQNNPHHDLSVWEHTLAAFDDLIDNRTSEEQKAQSEDYLVRNLSMLLHDIGKCDICSRQTNEQGHYTYKGHDASSEKLAEWALKKLKAPNNIIDRVKRLVGEHMRLHGLENNPSNKTLRKFIKDLAGDWKHSVDIAIADANGKLSKDPNVHEKYENYRTRMQELEKDLGGKTTPKRPINGHELMQAMNWTPGPRLAEAFKALDEQLLEKPDMSKEEAIEFIKNLNIV